MQGAYTIDDLEADIAEEETHLAVIRADRGTRYGKPHDTLANLRTAGGWRAAYVHAQECLNRLGNWAWLDPAKINPADFLNAANDLVNYAHYLSILFEQEQPPREK